MDLIFDDKEPLETIIQNKAFAFSSLSVELYHCELFLTLQPGFNVEDASFPPTEEEGEKLYSDVYDQSLMENDRKKIEQIDAIMDRSMETKRFLYLNSLRTYLDKHGLLKYNDKRGSHEPEPDELDPYIKKYLDYPDFVLSHVNTVIYDMMIHDFKEIPSLVDFSKIASFGTLAADSNDLCNFWYFPIPDNPKNFKSEIQYLQFIQTYNIAERSSNNLVQQANQLIGYWMAKQDRKKSSQPGGQAKIKDMEYRIERVKNLVLEKGKFTEKGFEIAKSVYHGIFHELFEYPYVSAPTKKKYKQEISRQLSEKFDKKVEIILK